MKKKGKLQMDSYMDKINEILKKNLSSKAFELWAKLNKKNSNPCWDKLTSSTKKYHRKENGEVLSVGGHTWEILYAADKIISMFEGIINKDVIFLSIILHDFHKYGLCKTCKFTESNHGQITADKIEDNRIFFLQILNENELSDLENAVRYHDGRWSASFKNKKIDKSFFTPEVLFLHTLDMMSSRNLIKVL